MKKIIYLLVGSFILLLTGCLESRPDELTYAYSYDLTMKNYDEFLEFSYNEPYRSASEDKVIELVLTLLDEEAILDDVTIQYRIATYSSLFDAYGERFELHTYFKDSPLTIEIPKSLLNNETGISISSISGKIHTNTSHEIDYTASDAVKQELFELIKPFEASNEFRLDTIVVVKSGGQTVIESSTMNFSVSPFYMSMVSNNEGFIIRTEGHLYSVYELGMADWTPYMRKSGLFEALEDTPLDTDATFEFELSDHFFYTFEDGVYYLSADTETLLAETITDKELLETLKSFYTEAQTTLSITVTENTFTQSLELFFDGGSVRVDMIYNIEDFEVLDLNNRIMMPPFSYNLVDDITDVTKTLRSQIFISGQNHYYMVELETSDYAFEIDPMFDLYFYDANGNPVTFKKSTNPLYKDFNNIYSVEAGTYLLGISSYADFTGLFDFSLFPINYYDTVADINHPNPLEPGTFYLNIEGSYDFEIVEVISETGGLLELRFVEASDFFLYKYEPDGSLSSINLNDNKSKVIYIELNRGSTKLQFSSWYPKDMYIDVKISGETWHHEMELSSEFPDDFTVSDPYHSNTYDLDVPYDGLLVIDTLLDDMISFGQPGFIANILIMGDHGYLENYTSFSISNNQTKLYLPEGDYVLRIVGILSYKIKISYEVSTDIGTDSLDLIPVDNIAEALYAHDLSTYQTFLHYPNFEKALEFTLTSPNHIYIHSQGTSDFTIENDDGDVLNFYKDTNLMLFLEAGNYSIKFPLNKNNHMIELKVLALLVNDPLVASDDYMLHHIGQIVFGEPYTVVYNYRGDVDYLAFTLDDVHAISFVSNIDIWMSIYDEAGNLVRSVPSDYYSTFDPGTYIVILSVSGYYVSQIGLEYMLTIDFLS